MNAKDLSIIVNTTNYAADFHGQFNLTAYQRRKTYYQIIFGNINFLKMSIQLNKIYTF